MAKTAKKKSALEPGKVWHTNKEEPKEAGFVLVISLKHNVDGAYEHPAIESAGWLSYWIKMDSARNVLRWAYVEELKKLP